MKVYSYVVDHDTGLAPNPYGGLCTLCLCKLRKSATGKKNVVELADIGDWVIGTGGANKKKSAGHGKLVYAMRVDKKPTRAEYYRRFRKTRVDSKLPCDDFEKHCQFALVSRHFYYFGANAVDIHNFKLEKNSRGFHYVDPADFHPFVEWLERKHEPGKRGEPRAPKSSEKPKGSKKCKSPC
jgi:hypothetical protein